MANFYHGNTYIFAPNVVISFGAGAIVTAILGWMAGFERRVNLPTDNPAAHAPDDEKHQEPKRRSLDDNVIRFRNGELVHD